jgi:flagellar hook protein FlgE
MLRSLFTGVSGMDANQEWIDSIGNDIANINTPGYKSSEVQFEDLLSQTVSGASAPTSVSGGVDPTQIGLGVKVAGTEANFTQGTSEQTGNPLDLSIQGSGFFITQNDGQTNYTRAGSFDLDGNGNLVTPDGSLVQGWPASTTGAINTSAPLGSLTIPTGQQVSANATQNVALGGNLAPQTGWTPPAAGPGSGGATTPQGSSTSVTVYAPNGATESLDLNFEQAATLPAGAPKGAVSAWTVEGALTEPGSTADYTNATTATLYFDASGNLVSYANQKGTAGAAGSTAFALTVPDETTGAAAAATQTFTLKVPTVTSNASADTASAISQDGNAPGTLQSYSIGTNGVIQGVFSNGQNLDLGQIAVATFANPGGLMRMGNTGFSSTANSGLAQVGQPGTGSSGEIAAGTLEASNVDLATEMTDLIEAQNGFQANGSVISTSNTLLQDLVNLKNAG